MMTQSKDIDYAPHSRPKKYFMVRPQLSTSVRETTYSDRIKFPGIGSRRFRLAIIGMAIFFPSIYLLVVHLGAFDFLVVR